MNYNTIIIGGGPAGMMAAIQSAKNGHKTLLIEKNNILGKKLLITGGGRCNITNSEFDIRKFTDNYKEYAKFLYTSFSNYGVKETLYFFHENDLLTKVENLKRTFPLSNKALTVQQKLIELMNKYKVNIMLNTEVFSIEKNNNIISHIILNDKNKTILKANKYILATGGASHPETGSNGFAFPILEKLGHKVNIPKPSLVPVRIEDKNLLKHQGKTIDNVKIKIIVDDKICEKSQGKILITHFGLSGPTILNLSKKISDHLSYAENVYLSLDILANFDNAILNNKLLKIFEINNTKKIKNALIEILPNFIIEELLNRCSINSDINCSNITKNNRVNLINNIKNFKIKVTDVLDESKAIITSGGVILEEIDTKNFKSKLFNNLYIIGDVLNIDRPSGGYSLQLCWTSGYLAGSDNF